MTQSVSFHFTSPQFVFESGIVVFTKGARLFSEGEFRTGEIKDGSVADVLVEGPIEFDATFGNLSVVRRDDSRRYQVALLRVTGALRAEDLRAGRVNVRLNLPVALIVRIDDPSGNRVSNVTVNLNLPNSEATAEVQTDDRGEIVLLGGAGRYSASVRLVHGRRLRPVVSADVEITQADAGERVLVLRIPPEAL